jgi:holo-[acyl-carrier protein] synthase
MLTGLKIGIDLVENERVRRLVDRFGDRFLGRIFGDRERDLCMLRRDPIPCLAARFAAKEALLKAFGVGMRGGVRWKDIQVLKDERGAPHYHLSGAALKLLADRRVEVSLTHERSHSSAVAVVF